MKTFYILKGFSVLAMGSGSSEIKRDDYTPQIFESLDDMREGYRKRPAAAGGMGHEYQWMHCHYDLGSPTLWAVRELKPTQTSYQLVGMEICAENVEDALIQFEKAANLL
jgi:hypothetical protein